MKRKWAWPVLFAGFALAGIGAGLPLVLAQDLKGGIVGGADGPTYRFLLFHGLEGLPFCLLLLGATLVATAAFYLLFFKMVKTCCSRKTTVLSLGISATGALGLICFLQWYAIAAFGEQDRYPVAHPLSISVGLLALCAFGALVILYPRQQRPLKGIVLDGLTAILWLPAFFFAGSCLLELLF